MAANEIPLWFKSQIAMLFAMYPSATLSSATIVAWWSVLGELGQSAVKRGVTVAAAASPMFIPSAMAVRDASGGGVPRHESKAITAWPEVLRLAKCSSSAHSDPIARETIRLMGGGERLGRMKQDELEVWGRKEFERIYIDVATRIERGGNHLLDTPNTNDGVKQITDGMTGRLTLAG